MALDGSSDSGVGHECSILSPVVCQYNVIRAQYLVQLCNVIQSKRKCHIMGTLSNKVGRVSNHTYTSGERN